MRKFLKTSHVISRIFLYICVIGVLLLYFFKPGVLTLMQRFVPDADAGSWLALTTTLSIAAVMFAASELAYKSLLDNEFMITLSESVLKPVYSRYDLSDKRFSKPAKGEFDFNASLRDVTDGKARHAYLFHRRTRILLLPGGHIPADEEPYESSDRDADGFLLTGGTDPDDGHCSGAWQQSGTEPTPEHDPLYPDQKR